MGVVNAAQAESSGWTLKIGNKIFSTAKPFRFNELPFELREEIILLALEDSKALLPPPPAIPAGHPFEDPTSPYYNHPLNPLHPDFVNAAGERQRNMHPVSAWRWTAVSRAWWAVLRARLWKRTWLRGPAQYKGFLRLAADPDSCFVTDFVRTLVLDHGWDTWELYAAIRAVPAVDSIVYAPAPAEQHREPFGVRAPSL
jgi:hypothetical protein